MSIINLLNQIREEQIVLPAIQRDFVWDTDRIFKLLDSVMRGYPVGIILLWETYSDIQYRSFVRDYHHETVHTFHDNPQKRKLKLVLDGQQRLQSLYVALYGTYESESLYFDVLSGRDSDDMAEEKYIFDFAQPARIQRLNERTMEQLGKQPEERDRDFEPSYFIKVPDLFVMTAVEKMRLRQKLTNELSLEEVDKLRLEINVSLLDESLSRNENILKLSVVDEDLQDNSPSRKSESDVVEIFVRTNTAGIELNRSDLVFSMLKLNWKESATALPDFVRGINSGNSFDLNNDFVIRCLFAASDLGTKFNLDLLRRKSNVKTLQTNFQGCCDAINATIDFVQSSCWCQSSRLVGGSSTMIPFVYYLFHMDKHEVPKNQVGNLRKAFYVFAFSKPFSRYADSRLWAYIRSQLKPLAATGDERFPLKAAMSWVDYWEGVKAINEELLQRNAALTLHLIQGLTGAEVKYERNLPQIDHIFPQSELRKKGYDEAQINHFANYWILARGKNQNKGAQNPAEYFQDVEDAEMKRALIDRGYFDYRRYTTFLKDRGAQILNEVKSKLGIRDEDFTRLEG